MRTISAPGLAKLATQYGTEPINVIEIQWVEGGPRTSYSDRDLTGVNGKILTLGDLDDIVQVSGDSQSQQINLTLDDTDGSIKGILDTTDVHKRSVWIYQWFDGLSLSDKFLIFKGVINSPLVWDEGARTISLTVISRIEDVETGFSIEEGDFINPPEELIGKPWPLCFGTVVNVPALRTQTSKRGILSQGMGIHDFTLERRIRLANELTCPDNFVGFRATNLGGNFNSLQIEAEYEQDADCLQNRCELKETLNLQLSEQLAYEISPVQIFGGEKFPQNTTITLNINGGKFIGKFSGDIFTITGRLHPENDGAGNVIVPPTTATIRSNCGIFIPASGSLQDVTPEVAGQTQTLGSAESKASWDKYNKVDPAIFFWANAGSTVAIDGDEEILYIANILPSTVLRVAAFRELNGGRLLVTVPDSYYTIRETDYNGYNVVEIVFSRPLSLRDLSTGGGWSDDIYVTLTSSVGPNTVDILEWFISTYTSYTVDSTSFTAVRALIDNYPMNFPLLTRKNLLAVLQEIAYQARCALWMKDDVFYIKYLSLEPTGGDDTITESDVTANSLRVEHTPTEDLITKYVANWRYDYSLDKPNTVILRSNVKKYGTHEQTFDYYCFNILELIRKTATFWLIRKANTWRRAILKTPISKMKLETFDTVSLTLPDVADGTIFGVVEKANYNSDTRSLDFEIWTPCISGTKTPYHFAWPADIEELDLYPTIEERNALLGGSGTQPNFSIIAPNGHPLSNPGDPGLFQGFAAECNGSRYSPDLGIPGGDLCRPDHGTKFPSDRGNTKPTVKTLAGTGTINTGTSPIKAPDCCSKIPVFAPKPQGPAIPPEEKTLQLGKSDLPNRCGGNCEIIVNVQSIIPTLVVKPPGSDTVFGSNPGDMGNLATGTPTSTECFTFNSKAAALAFYNSQQADVDSRSNYGWTVGHEDKWNITHGADLGVDNDPSSPNFGQACPEPSGEDQAMTAYSQTS